MVVFVRVVHVFVVLVLAFVILIFVVLVLFFLFLLRFVAAFVVLAISTRLAAGDKVVFFGRFSACC